MNKQNDDKINSINNIINTDVNSNNINIESLVNELVKLVSEYEILVKDNKIQNISEIYNQIIKKKDECTNILNKIKSDAITMDKINITIQSQSQSQSQSNNVESKLNNSNKENDNLNQEFDNSINRILNIKKTTNFENMDLSSLINLYESLNNDRKIVQNYLNSKQMEIIELK